MTYIIIVDKYGKVKEQNAKDLSPEDLYKKASFKSASGFTECHKWEKLEVNSKTYTKIAVYGKTKGNAGRENKYEYPPPIDTTLFFGNMLIIHYDENDNPVDLRKDQWNTIYEQLMGGFESLDSSDEESEEEEIDPSKLNKYGYENDGFVVDDEDLDELDFESELSEEEYFS